MFYNGFRLVEFAEHKTSLVLQTLNLDKMSIETKNGNLAKPLLPAGRFISTNLI